jgi:ferritin-like metal-binding protein YciE
MTIKTMDDLFVHMLKDIYFAENQIVKALPKMARKADAADLKAAFEEHLEETKGHVDRLKAVFKLIKQTPAGEECPAIEGIIKESEELMKEIGDANTLDAALIAAAQAVEHYEITRYGTLVAWAEELGHADASKTLRQTLAEEKAADSKLSTLGKMRINVQAKQAREMPHA